MAVEIPAGKLMITSLIARDGHVIKVTNDMIPVHYLSDIDANWHFTDTAGHEHRCEYSAADHWPTLKEVAEEGYWCADCDEEHEDVHLECKLCGEHIQPGMTGPGTKFIQGLTSYFIDDEPVTREQALVFAERLRS